MPLFEYICRNCQEQFELLVRGEEKPQCPSCGSRKLDKQLSAPAAHTAGGGQSSPSCGTSPESCGRQ